MKAKEREDFRRELAARIFERRVDVFREPNPNAAGAVANLAIRLADNFLAAYDADSEPDIP